MGSPSVPCRLWPQPHVLRGRKVPPPRPVRCQRCYPGPRRFTHRVRTRTPAGTVAICPACGHENPEEGSHGQPSSISFRRPGGRRTCSRQRARSREHTYRLPGGPAGRPVRRWGHPSPAAGSPQQHAHALRSRNIKSTTSKCQGCARADENAG